MSFYMSYYKEIHKIPNYLYNKAIRNTRVAKSYTNCFTNILIIPSYWIRAFTQFIKIKDPACDFWHFYLASYVCHHVCVTLKLLKRNQ